MAKTAAKRAPAGSAKGLKEIPVTSPPLGRDYLDPDRKQPWQILSAFTDPKGRWLFTGQGGKLFVYEFADPLAPRLLGSCALGKGGIYCMFGEARIQWIDEKTLFVANARGSFRVDLADPARPRLVDDWAVDWARSTTFLVKDRLFFFWYLHDADGLKDKDAPPERKDLPLGDGLGTQLLGGGTDTVKLLFKRDLSYAADAAQIGNFLYLAGQDWIWTLDVADPAQPKDKGTFHQNGNGVVVCPFPQEKVLCVMEQDWEDKYALATYDVSKGKPKRQNPGRIFAKQRMQTWAREGDRLYMVVRAPDNATSLCRAKVSAEETIEDGLWPLPLTEDEGGDVTALFVRGDRAVLLFEDGKLRAFQLP